MTISARKPPPPLSRQGFTLLEILLAIFVFSLVISMLSMTMGRSMALTDSIEQQAGLYTMARTTMLRLQEEMEAIPLLPPAQNSESGPVSRYQFVIPEQTEARDEGSQVIARFISTADLPAAGDNLPGLPPASSLITYETVTETDTTLTLWRTATPLTGVAPEERAILCEQLTAIEFQVTDIDGQQHGDWDTDANPQSGLPQQVTVTLRFHDPGEPSGEIRFLTSFLIPVGLRRP